MNITALLLTVFFTQAPPLQRFEFEQLEMAVPVRIVLYAESEEHAKRAAEAAYLRFHDLNLRLSDYNEQSEIRQFCDRALPNRFVRVSSDVWTVLQESVRIAQLTDGAFDPTVGQSVRLWRQARRSYRMPKPERLQKARATTGWQNLLFDETEHSIALRETGAAERNVRVDLGGIAKGYAIDEAVQAMKLLGVTRVMVDAGGDVGLGDPPPGKEGWTIAITPIRKEEKPTEFLTLTNCGLANSGDLYQFVEFDGVRYSHIVDPKTGLGLTNRLLVSVLAPNAMQADALASAFCVMGEKRALELAERLPGTETQILRILPDEQIERYQTTGFPSATRQAP